MVLGRTISFSILSDPNPGFKVTVYLQVECLKNGVSYGQSYYTRTGNHIHSIEWYHFQ